MVKLVSIKPSIIRGKKYTAVFDMGDGRTKTTHFGSLPYSDFTKHHSEERKNLYLQRHKANEDWNDPTTAGSLSRWVLWNKPTLSASISDFKNRFNL
jgi:hypothetical protein